jgi:two-component system, NarL family, sensor histidine kinase DevS
VTPTEPLADLLRSVLVRVEDLVAGEERLRSLLDAVSAVAGDLDLHATLERIVVAAAGLADAKYAALGVINPNGEGLVDFITYGMSPPTVAAIGDQPRGHGILGLIIEEPHPLRLHDLTGHPASYGIPASHPPMHSFLGVPVRIRDRVFGNLYLTDKRGAGDFTSEDEHAVVALAATAAVAIENARLFERLVRREKWLAATAQIQQRLLGTVDAATALAHIAEAARSITEAEMAVVVLEQDDATLRVEATAGPSGTPTGTVLPREGSLSDVVEHGATVNLSEGLRLPGLEQLATALLVPFSGPGGAGGALLVGSGTGAAARALDDDDLQALRGFAAQAALGMDRAQAQDDRATLAILADRDRIGRDLHDLVIQRLFATGLTLQSLARRSDNPALTADVSSVVDDLDATIRDIRGTIFALGHPEAEGSLRRQVPALVSAAEPMLGFTPQVRLLGPLDSAVPDTIRPHLIAVIVEALSNVGRHAAASAVDVCVRIEGAGADAAVVVDIRDDGKGFLPHGGGSGLHNMRERARDVGGTCSFVSAPGEGTHVRWRAPLSRPNR